MNRLRLALALAGLVLTAAGPPGVDVGRLTAETPAPTLAAYGLFEDAGARHPVAGIVPYAPGSPLFSDHAEKLRYLYIPPGAKARYRAEGVFDFPVGAVLIKTFAYPADFRRPDADLRFIETRLFIRRAKGWTALTYVWNEAQTEATLKKAGARLPLAFIDKAGARQEIDYRVPNANQCKECHSTSGKLTPIGPKARNLNTDFTYETGRENQLAHWARADFLAGAPVPDSAPKMALWNDPAAPAEGRARAYLDANCAHCHNPKGMANNSGLFLQWEETRAPALGVGKRPAAAGRGSGGLEVGIVPGDPDRSILVHRMASTEPGVMMPELGRSVVDEEGLAVVRAWIAGMRR